MEISKLKLEFYDLAAIILPGLFLIAEFVVALFLGFPQMLCLCSGNPRRGTNSPPTVFVCIG